MSTITAARVVAAKVALIIAVLMTVASVYSFAAEGSVQKAVSNESENISSGAGSTRDAAHRTDVLVVTTYDADYQWSKRLIEHFHDYISEQGQRMQVIYLPLSMVKNEGDMSALTGLLIDSLEAWNPKSTILIGSTTFTFCEDINNWRKDFPIMLVGGQPFTYTKEDILNHRTGGIENSINVDVLKSNYNVSAQIIPVCIPEVTSLMVTLIKDLKTIYYIGGSDQFSSSKEIEFRDFIAGNYPIIDFVPIESANNTIQMLFEKIGEADQSRSAIIFSSWPGVGRGETVTSLRVNSTLATVATLGVPVFTLRDNGWMEASSDIVGGCFFKDEDFFEAINSATSEMLSGISPRYIRPLEANNPVYKLNYEKMVAYNMNPALCPANTEFTHKPVFYETFLRFRWVAFGVILTLIFLFMFALQRALIEHKISTNTIDNLPLEFSRSRLIKDEKGNIVDFRVFYGNAIIRKYHEEWGEKLGARTFRETMPDEADEFLGHVNEAYKQKRRSVTFPLYNDKTDRFMYFTVVFLKRNTILVIGKDITKEKREAAALEEAKIAAEKADKMKTAFIHNISHEIRTPLNAITGFSQLLALPGDFCTEEEKEMYGRYIMNNTEMLTMVIDDLLNISSIEDGKYKINLAPCCINEAARHALNSVEHRIPPGVEASFVSDVDDSYMITSDKQRIQQILINYLTNACKHTDKGSIVVSVSSTENPDKITIAVTDTGHGIEAKDAEKIFERYVMLDTSRDGKGLGLYICNQLAALLQGEVKLDTNYTNGARFLLILNKD